MRDQYNDGINQVRETINQKIPDVADTLFNGFVLIEESINDLRSNCNEIVTQILQSYQVDNLEAFDKDVDIELQAVLDSFESFYDRNAINQIVGSYFTRSFMDIESQLRQKFNQLIKSIDKNEKAYQCYVNADNDSMTKMFVVLREEIIQVADKISTTIKVESIKLQNSVAVTISTMKSDLESCLNNTTTAVSCLNNYVSIHIDNYFT